MHYAPYLTAVAAGLLVTRYLEVSESDLGDQYPQLPPDMNPLDPALLAPGAAQQVERVWFLVFVLC